MSEISERLYKCLGRCVGLLARRDDAHDLRRAESRRRRSRRLDRRTWSAVGDVSGGDGVSTVWRPAGCERRAVVGACVSHLRVQVDEKAGLALRNRNTAGALSRRTRAPRSRGACLEEHAELRDALKRRRLLKVGALEADAVGVQKVLQRPEQHVADIVCATNARARSQRVARTPSPTAPALAGSATPSATLSDTVLPRSRCDASLAACAQRRRKKAR